MALKLIQQRNALIQQGHRVNKVLHPAKRDRYAIDYNADQSALQYDALRYVNNVLRPGPNVTSTGVVPFYSRSESNKPWMEPPGFVCEVGNCEFHVTDLSRKYMNYPVGKKALSAFIRRSQEKMISHLLSKHRSVMGKCRTCNTLINASPQVTDVLRKHCRGDHLSRVTRPDNVPQHLAQRVTMLMPLYDKYNITLPRERLTLARSLDKPKVTELLGSTLPNPGIQSNNQGWKVAGQLPIFEVGGQMITVLAPSLNTLKDSDYSPNHVNKDAYCKICDYELGDGHADDYESMSRRHKHWLGTSIINKGITFESLQLGRYWVRKPSDIGCGQVQLDLHKKAGAYLKPGSVICQAHKLRFVNPAETWKHWRECHQILEDEDESRAVLWPRLLQSELNIERLSFGPSSRRGSSVA